MRPTPPPELTEMLQRLGLARPEQVAAMHRRVQRLARDLHPFESVWVDALAQAGILTSLQAAEINAGRAEQLVVGPYVLCREATSPPYGQCYTARSTDDERTVRLLIIEHFQRDPQQIQQALTRLTRDTQSINIGPLVMINDFGVEGDRIWAVCESVEGHAAGEWLVQHGRLPVEVVLEIARQMTSALCALESHGLVHGDISVRGLIYGRQGRLVLPMPGLRAVVRPEEGYARAELQPDAYDYLAPERVTDAAPATVASDLYACGALWWHLLTGRPPLAGGNSLAKLRAAQTAKIVEAERYAPDTPEFLLRAIKHCLDVSASERPASFAALAELLGESSRGGRQALAECVAQRGYVQTRSRRRTESPAGSGRRRAGIGALAIGVLIAVLGLWPAGKSDDTADVRQVVQATNGDSRSVATKKTMPAKKAVAPTVQLASHYEDLPVTPRRPVTVLPAGRVLSMQQIEAPRGSIVRGADAARRTIRVPRDGLVIAGDNLRIENVDFVWDYDDRLSQDTDPRIAVLDVRGDGLELHGCTLRVAETSTHPPVAIRLERRGRSGADLELPSSRLKLRDCVVQGTATVIDCRYAGALRLELHNVLHTGTGPLVRLDHMPHSDEPLTLQLTNSTIRSSGPLLECRFKSGQTVEGDIAIQATDSVFSPRTDTGLITLEGPRAASGGKTSQQLLRAIIWTGQGSLLAADCHFAIWRDEQGKSYALDDAELAIEGLARSKIEFAAAVSANPQASQATTWLAPRRSPEAPGVDTATLPREPRRK